MYNTNLSQHSPAVEAPGLTIFCPNVTREMNMEDLSRTLHSMDPNAPHLELQPEGLSRDSGESSESKVGKHPDSSSHCSRYSTSRTRESVDGKSLYKRIIQEASHALPRTPTGLNRTNTSQPLVAHINDEQDKIPIVQMDALRDGCQPPVVPQFGVGKEFRFGSDAKPGVVLEVAPIKVARESAAAKRRCTKPLQADQQGSSGEPVEAACTMEDDCRERMQGDDDRLQQLEKDLAREKALRAELQQKLLKSVEAACFGSSGGTATGADANRQHRGDQAEDELRGNLAHSKKELDLLRSQLETQDQVIDMLCKKIPCKDVIETLGNTVRSRGAQEGPHVMQSIVEEKESPCSSCASSTTPVIVECENSFSGLVSAPGTAQALYVNAAIVSEERGVDVQQQQPPIADSSLAHQGSLHESAEKPEHSSSSLCGQVNVVALEHVHSSLEGASSSLDRALSATGLPTSSSAASLSPLPSAPWARRSGLTSRPSSLSPDVSSLTTVVRLTKEIQTLRQQHEGEQRLVEQATAECTSLSTRCSRLEKEKSTLSASFQRLTDTLSQSIATSADDEQAAPSVKELARLLEAARVELNELQEHDSMDMDTSFPTLSPAALQACSAGKPAAQLEDEWNLSKDDDRDGEENVASCAPGGGVAASMDLTSEWYQSWYEPEGDDAAVASFAMMNASRAVREDEEPDAGESLLLAHLSTSAWSVQPVSPAPSSQGACKKMTTRTTVRAAQTHSDFSDETHAESRAPIIQSGAKSALAMVGKTACVVVKVLSRGVWLLLCLCLHLFSLAILAGGITVSQISSPGLMLGPWARETLRRTAKGSTTACAECVCASLLHSVARPELTVPLIGGRSSCASDNWLGWCDEPQSLSGLESRVREDEVVETLLQHAMHDGQELQVRDSVRLQES